MDLNPQTYLEINGGQVRDAQEMLERIKKDGIDRAPVIVDIGCGSGNVTKLMADTIPHDRIVTFDIDPAMVKFAGKQLASSKVELFVQDISVPWEDLHKTLQSLEGKVDLVWSNRVLHWIPEKRRPQALKNIVKLLKVGGSIYTNITSIPNFNRTLSPEERDRNEKLVKIPGTMIQLVGWMKHFQEAGLVPSIKAVAKSWQYPSGEELSTSATVSLYSDYLTDSVPQDQRALVLESFKDLLTRYLATPIGARTVDDLGESHTEYYEQFQVVAVKR